MSEDITLDGLVGHTDVSQGTRAVARLNRQSGLITHDLVGKYAELSRSGRIFFAASQAATTWTVALNTTYTGLMVWNPVGSNVNLHLLQMSFGLSVAPVGIASVGLIQGGPTTDLATNGTPLSVYNAATGSKISTAGAGRASAGCTLTLAPIWANCFLSGFTAGALFGTSPAILDLNGMFTIPPGYYAGIGALTAVVGFASMSWAETPV